MTRRDDWRIAYLVILDREHHESMRILSEQWLVCLCVLDARGNVLRLLLRNWRLDGLGFLGGVDDWRRNRSILLVGAVEVGLLDRRVTHLQGLERRSSLQAETRQSVTSR